MALNDYEEVLKSFIHDDDKLVTYKWLSKELEVHVNVAKDILKQYWKKNKGEEDIDATFLLIGQLKDNSVRVEVVKESNLNVAKEKFVKIDCEHIYSLQKYLQDIELLTFAGDGDLRFSAIKCNEDYVRNDEEIESLRYVGNVRTGVNKPFESTKPINKISQKQEPKLESISKEKLKIATSKKNDIKSQEKNEEKEKSKIVTNKKNDTKSKEKIEEKEKSKIATNKKNDTKSKEKIEEKENPSDSKLEEKNEISEKKVSPTSKSSNSKTNNKVAKKPVQSKQAGFNNLFGKVASKPSDKSKDDSDENQTSSSDNSQRNKEVKVSQEKSLKISHNKEDKTKVEEKEKEKKISNDGKEKEKGYQQSQEKSQSFSKTDKIDDKIKPKNKKDIRGTKRNRSQENNSSSKRKRIIIMDSSEDESNKSDDDNDEKEEPMEIEEEKPKFVKKQSPSPPAEKRENGKRMVRKTIDKIFKDEDGYLVTKRVHVYEAASDTEEPIETKKKEPQKPKVAETKKKQATLMNFFKKS